ncbi:MAG: helix-turn-helix domain-containing protein [Wenzhouxiangellaceae bacterium]|nr:helix-turn-helix domain-containing protein [Wenzhouxiangellaceae bacterium]
MTETPNDPSSTDSKNPGSMLAAVRRKRQLSLAEAAKQLKLPRSVLEDIESGNMARIAPIYRRGYVINYARLLALDPDPLLACLEQSEPQRLRSVLPVSKAGFKFERFLKFATYLLVTTMIVPPLVYFFVLGGARLFESEVVQQQSGEPVQLQASSEPAKTGARDRIVEALGLKAIADPVTEQTHLSASALPMSSMRPLTDPGGDLLPEDGSEGSAPADPVDSGLATLQLELIDDSWIEIEAADGARVEFDLLRSGTVREYRARPPFRLLLGRGSAVSIVLDGQPVQFEGAEQAGVVEMTLGQAASDTRQPGPAGGAAD